jgi:hypothetical protein
LLGVFVEGFRTSDSCPKHTLVTVSSVEFAGCVDVRIAATVAVSRHPNVFLFGRTPPQRSCSASSQDTHRQGFRTAEHGAIINYQKPTTQALLPKKHQEKWVVSAFPILCNRIFSRECCLFARPPGVGWEGGTRSRREFKVELPDPTAANETRGSFARASRCRG